MVNYKSLHVVSSVDRMQRELTNIQFEIKLERALMLKSNYFMDEQEYVATFPSKRFNDLYAQAYGVMDRLSQLI